MNDEKQSDHEKTNDKNSFGKATNADRLKAVNSRLKGHILKTADQKNLTGQSSHHLLGQSVATVRTAIADALHPHGHDDLKPITTLMTLGSTLKGAINTSVSGIHKETLRSAANHIRNQDQAIAKARKQKQTKKNKEWEK